MMKKVHPTSLTTTQRLLTFHLTKKRNSLKTALGNWQPSRHSTGTDLANLTRRLGKYRFSFVRLLSCRRRNRTLVRFRLDAIENLGFSEPVYVYLLLYLLKLGIA